jgi:hypothetical protein
MADLVAGVAVMRQAVEQAQQVKEITAALAYHSYNMLQVVVAAQAAPVVIPQLVLD